MSFRLKLLEAAERNKSWLCVGLDPDISKLPRKFGSNAKGLLKFNRAVIEATSDLVCAYKPNVAFYECLGASGWEVLEKTIKSIPGYIPVIVDAKRGDIGNTAAMYARSVFEHLGADAVTVNPYLGKDSIKPFLDYMDKGIIILCLTSNESASDLQKQLMILENPPEAGLMTPQAKARTFAEFFASSTTKVYEHVAELATRWNEKGNVGVVVGATAPEELREIREIVGEEMPILVPGIGAQGGDLERSIEHGSNSSGELAIINVARGVIYAWSDNSDFKSEIRRAAQSYRARIGDAVAKKAAISSR